MLAKSTILLSLFGLYQSAALAAETATSEISSGKKGLFPVEVSLATSLSETPVNRSSADHYSWIGFAMNAKGRLPISDRSWIKEASLSGSLSVKDELNYDDNESNLENSGLSLTGIGVSFDQLDKFRLGLSLNGTLPTNSDDRNYLSYQGSVGAAPSLSYSYSFGKLESSVGVSFEFLRSYYQYDASKGGQFNPLWAYGPGLSLGLVYDKFSTSLAAKNTEVILSDRSRADNSYSITWEANYEWTPSWNTGLGWSQKDRTFGYDGKSSNVQFRYADLTVISANVTYTL